MQANNPENCPRCGKRLKFVLSKVVSGQTYKCLECDEIDPLKCQDVKGWLNSELARPADKTLKK